VPDVKYALKGKDQSHVTAEDEGTAMSPLLQLDETCKFETPQGFAYGGPTDSELRSQVAFSRKLVTGAKRTIGDLSPYLIAYVFEQAPGLDWQEGTGGHD
tara:strand:+ start:96 stop:395 length:300 start_codon:yes stop_codon:yes gene_type:complete